MNTIPSILCTGHIDIVDDVLQAKGPVEIDVIPYIEVHAITDEVTIATIREMAGVVTPVIFTSFNAVSAVANCINAVPAGWSIYCLSGKTMEVATQYFGAANIVATAPDSATLAEIIMGHGISNAVFFCGNIRMDTLPVTLSTKGVSLKEVVVYFTDTHTEVIAKPYDAMLFFSPSGVRGFFLQNKPERHTVMYAIGNTTAAEIRKYCDNEVIASPLPSKEHMLQMAAARILEKTEQ